MYQTVIISEKSDIADLLKLNLEEYLDSNVIVKSSIEDTLQLLNLIPNLDLIITFNISVDQVEKINSLICSDQLPARHITINSNPLYKEIVHPAYSFISKNANWVEIVTEAARIFNKSLDDLAKLAITDYYPIQTSDLKHFTRLPFDIFYKKNEFEYQIMFHANTPISLTTVRELLVEEELRLYIIDKNRMSYINLLADELSMLVAGDDIKDEELLSLCIESQMLSSHLFEQSNCTSVNKHLTSVFDFSLSKMNFSSGISSILSDIVTIDIPSSFQRNILTAILSSQLANASGDLTDKDRKVLNHTAMFHHFVLDPQTKLSALFGPPNLVAYLSNHYSDQDSEKVLNDILRPLFHVFLVADRFSYFILEQANKSSKINIPPIINSLKRESKSRTTEHIIESLNNLFIVECKRSKDVCA